MESEICSKNEKFFKNLAHFSRYIGSFLILTSLVLYLVQGWKVWSFFGRFSGLCSITISLLLIGHLYKYLTKDRNISSNLFFLSFLSSSVVFSYLGSWIYPSNAWLPDISSIEMILGVLVCIILSTITYLSQLTSSSDKTIATSGVLYSLLNIFLLLPTNYASLNLLWLIMIAVLLFVSILISKKEVSTFNLALLFPLVLFLAKASSINNKYFLLSLCFLCATLLIHEVARYSNKIQELKNFLSFNICMTWIFFVLMISKEVQIELVDDFLVLFLTLPICFYSLYRTFYLEGTEGVGDRFINLMITFCAFYAQTCYFSSFITPTLLSVFAATAILISLGKGEKGSAVLSVISMSYGIFLTVRYAVNFNYISTWMALLLVGLAFILSSTFFLKKSENARELIDNQLNS